MSSKPPGLPVCSEAFLQLCLKQTRLFSRLVLVQDNQRVRDRLGFQCCRDSSARVPLTQPTSIINRAKHSACLSPCVAGGGCGGLQCWVWGVGADQEAQTLTQVFLLSD